MTNQSVIRYGQLLDFVKPAVKRRSKSRRERRKESRPSELLAAALELFVERGFAATRLDDVVPAIANAETLVSEFPGGAGELLRLVVSGMWSSVGGNLLSGIPKLIIAESGNFPDLARFYYQEVIQRGLALMAGILKRGIQQGEFRTFDVDPTARAMMGPLLLMMLWRHSFQKHESDPLSAERYLDSYLTLVLEGLRVPTPGKAAA